MFCLPVMFPTDTTQDVKNLLIAYTASSNPDVMYLNEAMKEHDKKQFIETMLKEVQSQMTGSHYIIMKRSQVPEGAQIFPLVWAMQKRESKPRK